MFDWVPGVSDQVSPAPASKRRTFGFAAIATAAFGVAAAVFFVNRSPDQHISLSEDVDRHEAGLESAIRAYAAALPPSGGRAQPNRSDADRFELRWSESMERASNAFKDAESTRFLIDELHAACSSLPAAADDSRVGCILALLAGSGRIEARREVERLIADPPSEDIERLARAALSAATTSR